MLMAFILHNQTQCSLCHISTLLMPSHFHPELLIYPSPKCAFQTGIEFTKQNNLTEPDLWHHLFGQIDA
jgi:hypothetical protein